MQYDRSGYHYLSTLFMKRKCKIILLSLIFCFSLYGCGYFDNDGTDWEITISGNIKIQKQVNSSSVNLVLQESENSYAVLQADCLKVNFDELHHKIFVESFINEFNTEYTQFDIGKKGNSTGASVNRRTITKKYFYDCITNKKYTLKKWSFPRSQAK